jgi:hypothetical protein
MPNEAERVRAYMANEAPSAPNYVGVKFLGAFLELLGELLCILGVVLAAFCLLGGAHAMESVKIEGKPMSGTLGAVGGGILFFCGLVQIGVGQLFICFRDIARNSFNLQRLPHGPT